MNIRIVQLILLFCLSGPAYLAQSDLRVTLQMKETSVAKALKELSEKYDLSFAYDSYELSRLIGSWDFNDQTVDEALHILLDKFQLDFKFLEATYLIYPKEKIEVEETVSIVPREVIVGEVRDRNTTELLPFAVLIWQNAGVNFTTNADGKFVFEGFFDPLDSLRVFFVGYESVVIPATELNGSGYNKIFLLPQRYYLSDVVVTARQSGVISSDVASPSFVINPGELLSRYGLGEADLFRTVQLLPGVSATNESNNGLFLRGSNADQTLITLDGFTVYHMDHMFGTFSAINANAVKAMKLSGGPLETRLGGRAAGVLEMVGREGNKNKPTLKIDLGTISVGATVEAPLDSSGKKTFFACARRSITDVVYAAPYQQLFNTIYSGAIVSDGGNTNTFDGVSRPDFYFQDANVKLTLRPSLRNVFNISLYASRDQLLVQYADTFSNETVNALDVLYNDESTKRNRGASFRWVHEIDQRWQSSITLAASRFDGQAFSSDTIYEPLFDLTLDRFTSEERELLDATGRLEFTGNYRRNRIVAGLVFNRILTEVKLNSDGIITDLEKRIGLVSTLFAEDTWTILPGMRLVGGVRVNYFDPVKRFFPEPRTRFSWQWRKRYTLNLGYGRNNQFIQRVQIQNLYLNKPDIWEIGGVGETEVLTTDQVSAGLTMKIENFNIQAECFRKWNRGLAFSPGPYAEPLIAGTTLPQTLSGNGTSAGVDVLFDYFSHHHHFIAGYTWLKAVSHFSEISFEPVPEFFEQRHEIKTAYEFKMKGWAFSASWVYGSGRPYTPYLGDLIYELPNDQIRRLPYFGEINSSRLPAYHRLDLAAAKQWMIGRSEITVSAAVYNLYNRTNVRDYQYRSIRSSINSHDYIAGIQSINMIGFLPTINVSIRL
jgi:hypothetical protein